MKQILFNCDIQIQHFILGIFDKRKNKTDTAFLEFAGKVINNFELLFDEFAHG